MSKLLYRLARDFDEDRWWKYYQKSKNAKSSIVRKYYSLRFMRMTAKNGGYVAPETVIEGKPDLKHDLHGIHINRNAIIGRNLQICPNVVIGVRGGEYLLLVTMCILALMRLSLVEFM